MEKRIKDFEDYLITDDGKVISTKYNKRKILKTFYQKNGYEQIKLSKNNKTYHKLIHRLVAEAFISNPNKLPEINHKDKNVKNNNVINLEWCSHKENIYDSYLTMGPIRNFKFCYLEKDNKKIKDFNSIAEAARYGYNKFNCSYTSLEKYHTSKGYNIVCRD